MKALTLSVDDSEAIVCDVIAAERIHCCDVGLGGYLEMLPWWVRLQRENPVRYAQKLLPRRRRA